MIAQKAFAVEPWAVRETRLELDRLAQAESVFALSNGHIGLRGNLDEGEPHGLPGTYLNSFYELRPLPYAEAGYGYPESGQSLINVTNGKLMRLLVDDEPFDVRYGELAEHERLLDLRAGTLRRTCRWTSPAGKQITVCSTRLVSFTHRSVAAIEYIVEAVDEPVRLVLQSELVANEPLPRASADPRVAAVLESPLKAEQHHAVGASLLLIHRTVHSDLLMAAICDHVVQGPEGTERESQAFPDSGRVTVTCDLAPGERLRVVKYLAYGWSSQRSRPAIRDQVIAAMTGAKRAGWEGLVASQRGYLDDFWGRADVEVDGDAEVQQAVRFALFHVLQSGARAERRAIAAKGLTGTGYDGHAFWDTEAFVLPVLTYTAPLAARDALSWRYTTLPLAQERAQTLDLSGAAFPWRTIRGQECSAYWPAGTAAFHVNANIADAVVRYVNATGDVRFDAEVGLPLLVETARLWRSLGHHDSRGRFRIDGVTGPDEYSAVADNNVFTNLMAQRNLREAADAVVRHPERARLLLVDVEEAAAWRDAAGGMFVPYDKALRVHPQSEGFTEHAEWDFAGTPEEAYPLLLHYPYFDLYRKQVVKQADLVLAMYRRGDAFSYEQKARNFAYYERITVRDSSLSACVQSIMAAEVGQLDLAYDYLAEAALVDLDDLARNTRDGVHIASLAGTWLALVAGFGGLRDHGELLSFRPRLPDALPRLRFHLCYRGGVLRVEITPERVSYEVLSGPAISLIHEGVELTVEPGQAQLRPLKRPPVQPRPTQPLHRAPHRRTVDG
ncbi:MAG TPA: glycosyl hydrolase family 65 protein [Mycobacteriales bacterium]|nr:glycosyl hydrolase family 65 protein [Mycobacteriales bacterium]